MNSTLPTYDRQILRPLSDTEQAKLRAELHSTGFVVIEHALADILFIPLSQEAAHRYQRARRASGDALLPYRSRLADLGPVATRFLSSNSLAALLLSAFGRPYVVSPQSSCYTYYREGDHISTHHDDADGCQITVLVYLVAESSMLEGPESGLFLDIYRDEASRPTDRLRRIHTKPCMMVLGRGSQVWHGRPPLLPGERVNMLAACFTTTG